MNDFILVNPWIYDFAAYDLWARPLGLLKLGGRLRSLGYRVALLDCLDPFHPALKPPPKRKAYGTGHYYRMRLPKPTFFEDVPRYFARYGLPPALVAQELENLGPPKAFLVTSLMTYWYPGVFEVIRLIKKFYPGVPVFLGGIYAVLCPDHARKNLPGVLVFDTTEEEEILNFLTRRFEPGGRPEGPSFPVFYLQRKIPYVVLATSLGCPFSCQYCASKVLQPRYQRRPVEELVEEVLFWHTQYGVSDFAFYDDALLVDFENHLGVFLEKILASGVSVRFHTPNAVHVRLITRERASLMRRAGFKTLRLGFETVDPKRHQELDGKVLPEELREKVALLREAGFLRKEIGVYILWGLPGQGFEEVEASVRFVAECGASPHLAEYSPIPKTPLFEEAKKVARYPLEEDPIFHNNTAFPCLKRPDWARIERIKRLARALRA